jgi:hypothetical protein
VFGALGAFRFLLRDCGLPKDVAAGQTITVATGPACCILLLIGDLLYRGCLYYRRGAHLLRFGDQGPSILVHCIRLT